MKAIIFLPTQGPHLPRSGPAEQFDWRVQCRMAAALQKEAPDSVVYVPSAFQQSGMPSELEFYGNQLRAEGVDAGALLLESRGLDTVEQVDLALELAARSQVRLVVVSCQVHFPRVRYLFKGHPVEHVIAHGVPSPWLHFTHRVLQVAFPVIDRFGLREWWKRRVARRRRAGRQ